MRASLGITGIGAFAICMTLSLRQPAKDVQPHGLRSVVTPETEVESRLEWSSDAGRTLAWAEIAARGWDARAQALGENWAWFETAAELGDPFFLGEQRRACGETVGVSVIGVCSYTLSYVVRVLEPGAGEIVYARAELRSPESRPPATENQDPACGPYIGCLAGGRLGVQLSVPTHMSDEIGIREHIQSHWGDPVLFDPDRLPKLIDVWENSRRALAEQELEGNPLSAEEALRYRFIRSLVPYLTEHLARIQERGE